MGESMGLLIYVILVLSIIFGMCHLLRYGWQERHLPDMDKRFR